MVADSFYIKRNNNGFIVYDESNNKLYEFTEENNYYEILGNKYIMINKNDETLIIDKMAIKLKKVHTKKYMIQYLMINTL